MKNFKFDHRYILCPKCKLHFNQNLKINNMNYCINCNLKFYYNDNFYDFTSNIDIDLFYKNALQTWGDNLHRKDLIKNKEFIHSNIFIEYFGNDNDDLFLGDVLEIGSGRGNDIKNISKKYKINNYFAIDIGSNLYELSLDSSFNKTIFIRSDCLNLPLRNNMFDTVYSYGVIHHTKHPYLALSEAVRVLKNNGKLILYLYSDHENNFIKNRLIVIESVILNFFNFIPNKISKFLILLNIPFVYIFLLMPVFILRLLKLKYYADKIPLSFTYSFNEIYHNLQDRLLAPINHRFSRKKLKIMLAGLKMKRIKIKSIDSSKRSGHYIVAFK